MIGKNRLSLKELINTLSISVKREDVELRPVNRTELEIDVDTSLGQFIASLEVRCPGVVNELKTLNPYHKARVHTAMFAKTLGIDIDTFDSLWVELANAQGYVDVHNTEYRRKQLESLFFNDAYHTNANCTTLKRDRCCIGEACPKYIHEFPKRKRIIRKWSRKA